MLCIHCKWFSVRREPATDKKSYRFRFSICFMSLTPPTHSLTLSHHSRQLRTHTNYDLLASAKRVPGARVRAAIGPQRRAVRTFGPVIDVPYSVRIMSPRRAPTPAPPSGTYSICMWICLRACACYSSVMRNSANVYDGSAQKRHRHAATRTLTI